MKTIDKIKNIFNNQDKNSSDDQVALAERRNLDVWAKIANDPDSVTEDDLRHAYVKIGKMEYPLFGLITGISKLVEKHGGECFYGERHHPEDTQTTGTKPPVYILDDYNLNDAYDSYTKYNLEASQLGCRGPECIRWNECGGKVHNRKCWEQVDRNARRAEDKNRCIVEKICRCPGSVTKEEWDKVNLSPVDMCRILKPIIRKLYEE